MVEERLEEFDISLWIETEKEKYAKREKKRRKYLDFLKEKLTSYFKNIPVKEVYLVGSIVQEGDFYDVSDVDVAVEGLKEDYLKVYGDLEEIIERGVDLIELEKCKFSHILKRTGVRIL